MTNQEFLAQAMAFVNDDNDYLTDHERMSEEDERKLAGYERRDKLEEVDYHVERLVPSGCWNHIFSHEDKALVIKSVQFHMKNNPTDSIRVVEVTRKVIA